MALKQDFQIGNSFDSQTLSLGHAKKVWRRIDEQLPGGYHITNMADFAAAGLVRSGMPVAYDTDQDADARDIVVIPWASVVEAQGPTYVEVQSPTGNPKTKGYYEKSGDDYVATNDTSVTDNKKYYEKVDAVTTDGLNIIGFIQEDVPVYQHGTSPTFTYNYGTANVVVTGEIYGYMLGDTVAQANTVKAAIKAMSQKNGLKIRVID